MPEKRECMLNVFSSLSIFEQIFAEMKIFFTIAKTLFIGLHFVGLRFLDKFSCAVREEDKTGVKSDYVRVGRKGRENKGKKMKKGRRGKKSIKGSTEMYKR